MPIFERAHMPDERKLNFLHFLRKKNPKCIALYSIPARSLNIPCPIAIYKAPPFPLSLYPSLTLTYPIPQNAKALTPGSLRQYLSKKAGRHIV
jgi:hypothetical protein